MTITYDTANKEKMSSLADQFRAGMRAEFGEHIKIEDPTGLLDKLEEKDSGD